MKKHLLVFFLCLLIVNSLHAKADIYLATGVLTDPESTDNARALLEIDLKQSNQEIYGSEPFKSAYNTSHSFWDFIEGAAQLLGQNGWSIYWDSFIILTNNRLTQHYIDYFSQVSQNHDADLSKQIANYKASINSGNQVIVIAHSQGNYFTNEAYDALNECQKKSFYMLGTANPADHVSGMDDGRGALATLDNDPITFVPSSMSQNVINSDKFIIEGYSFKLPKYHYFDYYRNNNSVTQSKIDTFPEYAMHHYNENKTPVSISQSGIINIKLSWGNPSLHMNLDSEIGTKDVSYTTCNPIEHYYVGCEEDVSAGKYGVYVSSSGNADNSYLPQSVDLTIHAPGAVMVFDFNITTVDMLNPGHVADIIITEDKKSEVVQVADSSNTGSAYTTVRCYGDCQNENASGTYIDYLYGIQSKLKQALLGPLSNAGITLTKAEDFINNTPFYESSTSGGSSILDSGVFYFPVAVTSAIKDDELYIMSVTGGRDIDANDDGVLDSNVTINNGTVRAIVSGAQLKNDDFKVNILTEITFQATKLILNDELNVTAVVKHMDSIAKKMLFRDVQGDELSDYNSVVHWLPIVNKDKLQFDYDEKIEPIVQKIYNNEDIYLNVYKLLYAGKVDSFTFDDNATGNSIRVDLNSYADLSQLQKKDFVLKDSSGNSVDFTFEIVDGYVVIYPLNDLIEGQSYTLSFNLDIYDDQGNVYVDTQLHEFVVHDMTPPVIPESTIHINENYGGALPFNAADPSTPLKYSIVGGLDKDLFEINVWGSVSFKEGPNFERPTDQNGDNIYELDISVADSFSNMKTQSIRIVVDNVKEGPLLADTNLTVDENLPIGTYVGTVTVLNEGDGNLTSFSIYSDEFRIDATGKIYTKQVFDYERVNEYSLSVSATNSANAYAASKKINIKVVDIDEALPQVHNFTGSMDDHAPAGKVVGQLYVYPGFDEKVAIRLIGEGADDFDVNSSGHISVSATADLDHTVQKQYDLKAIASNSYGESDEANVTIYINVWTKQIGTSKNDYAYSITVDHENNIYVTGETGITYPEQGNKFISKYSSSGELLWNYEMNQSEEVRFNSIAVDKNGTVYVTGAKTTGRIYVYYDNTYDTYAAWIMALNSAGEVRWTKVLDNGAAGYDYFTTAFIDSEGYIIVSGSTNGEFSGYNNSVGTNIFFAKFSTGGDTEWIKQFDMTGNNIQVNAIGEFYFKSGNNVIKLDAGLENIILNKEITLPDLSGTYDYYYYDEVSFTLDNDGNILLLCKIVSWSTIDENGDYFYEDDLDSIVVKFNQEGELIWLKNYGSDKYEFPNDIKTNQNNEIYFAGTTRGNLYNNINKVPYLSADDVGDMFLTKLDADGNLINSKQFGSVGWDGIYTISIDENNDIYMTGEVGEALDGNTFFGNYDIFIMKVPY